MALFRNEAFVSHSGLRLSFKIECDALTEDDIETLAAIIGSKHLFGDVYGVPRGGLRLASALQKYRSIDGPTLIVDDVFTTGASMEKARRETGENSFGVVAFSRARCPAWITPIFQLADWAGP